MSTKKSILIGLFVGLFAMQRPLFAAVAVSAPDPAAWFDELLLSSSQKIMQPATYVVVKKTEKHYVAIAPSLTNDTFFADEVPADLVDFAVDLSQKSPSGGCAASPENMGYCVGASYALDVTKSIWVLYTVDASGEAQAVFSGKGSSNQNYAAWIQENLGFDGMILASKSGFLLAQVPATSGPSVSQALAIKGSQNKKYLGTAEKKGAGLLVIRKRTGKLATLSTVIAESGKGSEFEPGTKIIIEKQKNK